MRGNELSQLPCVENSYLLVENEFIAGYGKMDEIDNVLNMEPDMPRLSVDGACVLPCWCDSHTHIVFAASREDEFRDKIKGLSYAEIAGKGGGILNSAAKLRNLTEDELFDLAFERLNEVIRLGTGAIEIKSGYGLTLESEMKMLRVIERLKKTANIPVKATFLGAHAYPAEYKNDHEKYINILINEMLPNIAKENLAEYIDVFCEQGFFSAEEMTRVCEAGIKYGLKPKLHVNQISSIGGIEAAIGVNALSVDHLETMSDEEIENLANSETIATMLPTAAYFLRMPFPAARKMIDAGCAVALASDYNPGSSPSGNMNVVVSMSCIQMKMLPEEAINAATINGAYAMELEAEVGSIAIGKKANLIFSKKIPSLTYLPYAFGANLIDKMMINGEFL
ncbi:MAG TPA: imidazolonepropionase [Parafilimonas sp.]|nr:imidazolonepropionase [Parafilimonas sp.]